MVLFFITMFLNFSLNSNFLILTGDFHSWLFLMALFFPEKNRLLLSSPSLSEVGM